MTAVPDHVPERTTAGSLTILNPYCPIRTGTYTASVKVFTRNTWDWLEIGLRKGDADYITRHCRDRRGRGP